MPVAARASGETARGKSFAQLVLALLVALEDFPSPLDDAARQTREARNLDAVTFVGATGFHSAQKNDFARCFFDRDVDILHAGKKIGEFGQFVIVRSKKCARASVPLEMFDDGPRNGEAVERSGAAADFVEKDEAGRCRVIQDRGDFAHLHKKSRAATREVIAGADAREDAVGNGKFRMTRGNERAHLRHKNNQSGLPQIGGLAAHVRPGDEKQLLAARLKAEIVGHKALAALPKKLFDDRVASANDKHFAGGIEFGASIAAVGREFPESSEDIKLSNGRSGAPQASGFGCDG